MGGRCCWVQGKGGEGTRWEKAELLLLCHGIRGGYPQTLPAHTCQPSLCQEQGWKGTEVSWDVWNAAAWHSEHSLWEG